ncbi:MAG: lipoate--protein ligase family protein [Rubripirellula sp.]|nr:lipoate--protein ligase family protein [Rubripirellula sp.]
MHRMLDDFTDPADHLALDEAILTRTEIDVNDDNPWEVLRLWEFTDPVVVAGRSSRVHEEIDVDYCLSRKIPVLRRCTGGASVVGGPGCLMYSVVLAHDRHQGLKKIDAAHQYVMGRVLAAVQQQIPAAKLQGICDLTWQNCKCSGNSLRVTRERILYHGTFLYDFDLSMLDHCLRETPRHPDYRAGRDHGAFVTNVPLSPERLKNDLETVFDIRSSLRAGLLEKEVSRLREQRYDSRQWHYRH